MLVQQPEQEQQQQEVATTFWGTCRGRSIELCVYSVRHTPEGLLVVTVVDTFFGRPARKGIVGCAYGTTLAEATTLAAHNIAMID